MSRGDMLKRITTVTMIVAAFCTVRVATSERIALVCSVSVRMRARICPVLVRPNQGSGSRCMCEKTACRRSRVMYSCSDAPSCPPPQSRMFLSTTMAMITRITARSDPIGSAASRKGPMSRVCRVVIHPIPPAICVGDPKSVFRNGISSVNATPSSTAAVTFITTFPTIRQVCGRRNARRRR